MDDDKKYCYKYPRPAVTTDCVLLSPDGGQMQVLLVERGHEPYKGCWALPGGFINIDEDALPPAAASSRRRRASPRASSCSWAPTPSPTATRAAV